MAPARILLALSSSLLAASACNGEGMVPDVGSETTLSDRLLIDKANIGTYSLARCTMGMFRCQMVDIADLTSTAYAIGFVDGSGNLKYTFRDTRTGELVAPFQKGTNARWIRASTSKAWNSFGCDINYFAVAVDDPTPGIFLDAVSKCPSGFTVTRQLVDSDPAAKAPAVATKGSATWGDLLFAWTRLSSVHAKVFRFRYQNPGGGWTPTSTYSVSQYDQAFDTDAIYNTKSNQWIVGYMFGSGGSFAYENGNLVLSSSDNALPAEISHRTVGGPSDGHHTSVAYNPLSADGSYLWWHQDLRGTTLAKAFYLHDSNGAVINAPVPGFPTTKGYPADNTVVDPPSNGVTVTQPVAATSSASIPYIFMTRSTASVAGMRGIYGSSSTKAWSLLDDLPVGGSAEAAFALRSLASETVAVVPVSGTDLRVVVSDFPGMTQLATLWYDNGYNGVTPRVLYTKYENERDVIYQKSQTAISPGNGSWTTGARVNLPTSTAKQIVFENTGGGVLEAFYITPDYVLNHTRQTTANADVWNGDASLTTPAIKAMEIATAWNAEGRIEIFYTRYPDGVLCHARQTDGSFAGWTGEQVLNTATTTGRRVVAAAIGDGRIDVIFTGREDNVLYHTIQTSPGSASWTAPAPVIGASNTARQLAVYYEWVDRLRLVYTRWSDDKLYDTWQTSPGVWNGAHQVGGGTGVGAKQLSINTCCGPLSLFFIASGNDLPYYFYQTTAGGSWNSTAVGLGPTRVKRVATTPEEVFWVGLDDALYHSRINASGWNPISTL